MRLKFSKSSKNNTQVPEINPTKQTLLTNWGKQKESLLSGWY